MRVESTSRLLTLATTKHSSTNGTIYYKKGIIRKGKYSNASIFFIKLLYVSAQYNCKHKL
jgi:hypothetical protein